MQGVPPTALERIVTDGRQHWQYDLAWWPWRRGPADRRRTPGDADRRIRKTPARPGLGSQARLPNPGGPERCLLRRGRRFAL